MRSWWREARGEPYLLTLHDGGDVALTDPHRITGVGVCELADYPADELLVAAAGGEGGRVAAELSGWSLDEIDTLLDDYAQHFGLALDELDYLGWVTDRFGDALEADLHERFDLDLLRFFDGTHPTTKLSGLVSILRLRKTSYLTWAMLQDEELYRETVRRHGPQKAGKRRPDPPETFEVDLVVQLLMSNDALLQQVIHAVKTKDTKKRNSKPQIDMWPAPRTAKQAVERKDARAAAEHIDSIVWFAEDMTDQQRTDVFGRR